jgi:nucleotide-binding universal stress UspA family protein
MSPFKKILVPTDFSPAAEEAFQTAVSLARACGGEVVVAHVARAPAVVVENGRVAPAGAAGQPLNLWNMFRAFVSNDPAVPVTHEVVVIPRVSAARVEGLLEKFGCDLVVVGSHRHGWVRRLFRASFTDAFVHRARCPVLVVKAPTGRPVSASKPTAARPSPVA